MTHAVFLDFATVNHDDLDLTRLERVLPGLVLYDSCPPDRVTPHVAWAAREARQRCIDQIAENVEAFFRGERLRRVA